MMRSRYLNNNLRRPAGIGLPRRSNRAGLFALALLLLTGSCRNDSRSYSALVKKELSSGKVSNQLLLDIRFGMTRKAFYSYCWTMHNKGTFEDGANSTAVLYHLRGPGQLRYPASLNFYPEFRKDSIYKMWAQVEYDAWAPWNRNLFADSLMLDVVRLYSQWYPGNEFLKLTDPHRGTIYVKVDGNRRIIVGKKDDAHVNVDYTNLLAENVKQP
jgi:hypothetical protein